MKGLQVDFKLKRSTKINKLMSYLLVLALFIISMAVVYTQYIDALKKKNDQLDTNSSLIIQKNQLAEEKKQDQVALAQQQKNLAYEKDYKGLKEAIGTTRITFTVDGTEIVQDGIVDEVGFYTSNQDKLSYILEAVKQFNTDYEDEGIVANIGEFTLSNTSKTIKMKITFSGNTLRVSDFRRMMQDYYISIAYLPFLITLSSQTATSGIDEGLELTLTYA